MSLAEVLDGLHWEAECTSDTAGMGPLWVNDASDRPSWAVLYLVRLDTDPSWEIGLAQDFTAGMASMPRAATLSSSGLGMLVNFPAGRKTIRFADAVPEALKRYMRRLERDAEARPQETAGNRAAAWERLTEAGQRRTEA